MGKRSKKGRPHPYGFSTTPGLKAQRERARKMQEAEQADRDSGWEPMGPGGGYISNAIESNRRRH